MKLLIITSLIPYPLDEGGKISQYAFAEKLQHLVDLNYIIPAYNSTQLKYAQEFQRKLSSAKMNIISPIHREDKLKKSPLRRLVSFFYNCYVNLKKKKGNIHTSSTFNDFERRIDIFEEIESSIIDKIMATIEITKPDLIQVEHTGFLNLCEALPVNIKKIFVHHEIIYARLSSSKIVLSTYERYKINLVRDLEVLLLNKYDAIITFSEDDQQKLLKHLNNKVYALPFPVMDEAFEKIDFDNFQITKIVFVGPEDHYPNYDGVVWYFTIAEEIFNKTGLKTHIIGKWNENTISTYSKEYFIFEGFVENIKSFTKNSISIVPIRIGSGIRTKILYSLAQFSPTISTTLGCEGIGLTNNKNILIENDISSFKDKIIELATNNAKAYEISENGFKFISEKFSQEKLTTKRFNIYIDILLNKE